MKEHQTNLKQWQDEEGNGYQAPSQRLATAQGDEVHLVFLLTGKVPNHF